MTYTFKRHLELKSILTKEILKEKYLVKKLSTVQIAKELKVSKRNVLSYMEKYQIKRRTAGEAQKGLIYEADPLNRPQRQGHLRHREAAGHPRRDEEEVPRARGGAGAEEQQGLWRKRKCRHRTCP